MDPATRSLTLPDGRTADVFLGGDPGGTPLVMHHGTPSDSTTFSDWHEACMTRGLRLVCVSRPGYATSTRLPGRDVAHASVDTVSVLDGLGLGSFLTAGWSGGGPHALACAALLPDRCLAAASLAGVGAYGAPDLDFLAGMGPENVEEFGAAVAGEDALVRWMAANAEPFRQVTGEQIAEAFGGLVPQIDKDVLNDGYAALIAAKMRRALEHGFDVGGIRVPVTVWQGDLDLMVPLAHGPWLAAHVPTATARIAPGHGHLSLVTRFRDDILDDLLAASDGRR